MRKSGMVGLCVKRSALSKVTPVRFPARCELSCALVLCCATGVFQTIRFSSLRKNQTLSILAVLRGQRRLAFLLLEHVVSASFAIQLLAASRMISPSNLKKMLLTSHHIGLGFSTICHLFWKLQCKPFKMEVIQKIEVMFTSSLSVFNSTNNFFFFCELLFRAVLESHHAALAFQLTTREDRCNIFKELDR